MKQDEGSLRHGPIYSDAYHGDPRGKSPRNVSSGSSLRSTPCHDTVDLTIFNCQHNSGTSQQLGSPFQTAVVLIRRISTGPLILRDLSFSSPNCVAGLHELDAGPKLPFHPEHEPFPPKVLHLKQGHIWWTPWRVCGCLSGFIEALILRRLFFDAGFQVGGVGFRA